VRALVARGDAIGDSLLSLPAIQALGRHAQVTVVSSPSARGVFEGDPAVAKVVLVGSAVGTFDMAFSFTEKMWGYDLLRGSAARVGFWPGASKPFKSLMLWPRLTHRVAEQGGHEVERYFRMLSAVGIQESPGPIRMVVPEAERAWAQEWVDSRGLAGFVALHLSEKWLRGGWPREFLQGLVKRLDAVVAYGPAEAEWAPSMEARAHFYDPSLKRYAAVLSHARVLVTMDTSAVHLATSEGIPIVDVFPEEGFEQNTPRWRPWMVQHELIKKPEWQEGAVRALSDAIKSAVERLSSPSAARP
jgi:ADP-heptose:LPS heptosyltransferase